MLMISEAARAALEPLFEGRVEILPLSCDDGKFWIANVTNLVEGLDAKRSDILRDDDSNEILLVKRASLLHDRVESAVIFKLREDPRGLIYVTTDFVEAVRSSDLVGIGFEPVQSL